MRARASGAWEDLERGIVWVDGAWKNITKARAYVSGAWEDVAAFVPSLSLAISPSTASAVISGPGTATTNLVTATPTGGQAPYTYAWTRLSGDGSATSAATANTRFSTTLGLGDETSGSFRCTVTDALGTTATADVTANFISIDPGGGF